MLQQITLIFSSSKQQTHIFAVSLGQEFGGTFTGCLHPKVCFRAAIKVSARPSSEGFVPSSVTGMVTDPKFSVALGLGSHMAAHMWQLVSCRLKTPRESEREQARWKSPSFGHLSSEETLHHICHSVLDRSESVGLTTPKGRGWQKHQEAGILGDHLRYCPPWWTPKNLQKDHL